MKRIIIPLLLLFTISLFGCSKMLIEQTIEDFEKAVNEDNAAALKETISEESEYSTAINTEEWFQYLLDYFQGYDINYYNYDISINGSNADAYVYADFDSTTEEALFVMKKKEALFSFIFPDWKIYQYWDTNNTAETLDNIWKKLMEKYYSK